jgi:hypothetical protein
LRPILLARSIHHHARHTFLRCYGQQFHLLPAEAFVLQMIVGVVKTEVHGDVATDTLDKFPCELCFSKFNFTFGAVLVANFFPNSFAA